MSSKVVTTTEYFEWSETERDWVKKHKTVETVEETPQPYQGRFEVPTWPIPTPSWPTGPFGGPQVTYAGSQDVLDCSSRPIAGRED